MEVTLTGHEMMQGGIIGLIRTIQSIAKNHKNKHGLLDRNWDAEINSSLAEMAVAKVANAYWGGHVDIYKGYDVAQWQIRYTRNASNRLIVREDDNKKHIYILVTGIAPTYKLQGWIKGEDAFLEKYISAPADRSNAFFIPISDLRPINTLIKSKEA